MPGGSHWKAGRLIFLCVLSVTVSLFCVTYRWVSVRVCVCVCVCCYSSDHLFNRLIERLQKMRDYFFIIEFHFIYRVFFFVSFFCYGLQVEISQPTPSSPPLLPLHSVLEVIRNVWFFDWWRLRLIKKTSPGYSLIIQGPCIIGAIISFD